jgi:hypothetical protein
LLAEQKEKEKERRPRELAERKSCRVGRWKAKAALPVAVSGCLHASCDAIREARARRGKSLGEKRRNRRKWQKAIGKRARGRENCMQAEMQSKGVRVSGIASPGDVTGRHPCSYYVVLYSVFMPALQRAVLARRPASRFLLLLQARLAARSPATLSSARLIETR